MGHKAKKSVMIERKDRVYKRDYKVAEIRLGRWNDKHRVPTSIPEDLSYANINAKTS